MFLLAGAEPLVAEASCLRSDPSASMTMFLHHGSANRAAGRRKSHASWPAGRSRHVARRLAGEAQR